MATFDPATGTITSDRTVVFTRYINAALDIGHIHDEILATIPDHAPEGASLTQTTDVSRPLFKTNAFGTKPGYFFDKIDDRIDGVSATTRDQAGAIVLFKPTADISRASTLQVPVGTNPAAVGNTAGIALGVLSGSFAGELVTIAIPGGSTSWSTWEAAASDVFAADTPNILTHRWNAASPQYDIFHNGSANKTNDTNGTPVLGASSYLCLGATNLATHFFGGVIGFFAATDVVLTDAEKAAVHSYLDDEWGATAADYNPGWSGQPAAAPSPWWPLFGQS